MGQGKFKHIKLKIKAKNLLLCPSKPINTKKDFTILQRNNLGIKICQVSPIRILDN